MAHFAQLDENNAVIQVVVVSNNNIVDENGIEQEVIGIGFVKSLYGYDTVWKQASYNGKFRGAYPSSGFSIYMENVATLGVASTDVFMRGKPYNSWVVDPIEPIWVSPLGEAPGLTTTQSTDGYFYRWDEDVYQSDNTAGWVLYQRPEAPTISVISAGVSTSGVSTITTSSTPTFVGTATSDITVDIYSNTNLIGVTTADSSGNWSFTVPETTPLSIGTTHTVLSHSWFEDFNKSDPSNYLSIEVDSSL